MTFQSISYGNWTLILETDSFRNYLPFDANGLIDNLPSANLESSSLNEIGVLFKIMYWLYLVDFGPISLTVYPLFQYSADLIQPKSFDFVKVEQLPHTYNMFVNSSRYKLLSTWMANFIQYIGGSPPMNRTNAPLTNGLPCRELSLPAKNHQISLEFYNHSHRRRLCLDYGWI